MSIEALIRRDRIVTAAGLLTVTLLAWLYLLRESMTTSMMKAGHAREGPTMAEGEPSMEMGQRSGTDAHGGGEEEDLPD